MTSFTNNICLIVPVLNPGPELLEILTKLIKSQPFHIIVVNDGSSPDSMNIFTKIATLPQTTLLNHVINKGKGAALKTGFSYFLNHFQKNKVGVVCFDGDGQHLPEDILNIAKKLQADTRGRLILGTRNFTKKIPFRSKFGNNIMIFLFNLFHNIVLTDTQTGLRGIPNELIELFSHIPYNHYEFESACIIKAKQQGIPISEVKIATVYHGRNESSNFLFVQDSYKILKVIILAGKRSKRLE